MFPLKEQEENLLQPFIYRVRWSQTWKNFTLLVENSFTNVENTVFYIRGLILHKRGKVMPKYETNMSYPFMTYMPEMKIVIDDISLKRVSPVIDNDGVITNQTVSDMSLMSHISCVGKFVKLMTDNIRLISNLGSVGIKMFAVVAVMVQMEAKDRAYVHITYDQAKDIAKTLGHNLPKSSFYKGMDQLIENDIIAKAIVTNRFWINIGILFNGDFARLPEIMNADPVYLQEQGLAKIVKKRSKKQ